MKTGGWKGKDKSKDKDGVQKGDDFYNRRRTQQKRIGSWSPFDDVLRHWPTLRDEPVRWARDLLSVAPRFFTRNARNTFDTTVFTDASPHGYGIVILRADSRTRFTGGTWDLPEPLPHINILEAKPVLYALDLLATSDVDEKMNYRYQFRIDNTTALAVIRN
jgi:hypothetical protein